MKAIRILILIVVIALFVIGCTILVSIFFVNSIDGNRTNNKREIKYQYYFDNRDKSIWKNIGYECFEQTIEKSVDSIGESDSLIYGYSSNKYFVIDPRKDTVYYYPDRDSFILNGLTEVKLYLNSYK